MWMKHTKLIVSCVYAFVGLQGIDKNPNNV